MPASLAACVPLFMTTATSACASAGCQLVVAGDHDRLDAHPAQFREAFLDLRLDDVLELDDAEHVPAFGDDQRRGTHARHFLHAHDHFGLHGASVRDDPGTDRVERALASAPRTG